MKTLLKAFAVAAALVASANSIVPASAQSGLMQACQAGSFTPHGVWDCR